MAVPSTSNKKIKFHYGYGGKIMPSRNGGKLRYAGGTNGILAVDRDITYNELIVKLWDSCGPSMSLRCKLPMEDLDLLVHVTSDGELADIIQEYDRTDKDLKIRAILDPLPPVKKPITKVLVDDIFSRNILDALPPIKKPITKVVADDIFSPAILNPLPPIKKPVTEVLVDDIFSRNILDPLPPIKKPITKDDFLGHKATQRPALGLSNVKPPLFPPPGFYQPNAMEVDGFLRWKLAAQCSVLQFAVQGY